MISSTRGPRQRPPGTYGRRGRRSTDLCPLCQSELGGRSNLTRRRPVFSSVPGTFIWRCPDCNGVWRDDPSPSYRSI